MSVEKQVFSHRSVLLDECIEALAIKPEGTYIDGTAGGGGHSFEIAKRLESGRLIAIDQDEAAIAAAGSSRAISRAAFMERAPMIQAASRLMLASKKSRPI